MLPLEEIKRTLTESGCKFSGDWVDVSERPGKEPFAKELEYNCGSLWGKVHVRKEGDVYVLVISKDVFNWKDRLKELKLNSEIVDAAGGLMWIKLVEVNELKSDLNFLKSYIDALKQQKK